MLVHRRLAIIDPRPDAAQPMATPDASHQLLFNGEVYNYREIARDLESRGERFSTSSDTEVLLRLIVREGPAALSRIRGMFALACWSERDRTLLLARDRFGIKPLYVAVGPEQIGFASELSALTVAGVADRRPSPAGVLAFLPGVSPRLRLRWESLTPGTWFRWGCDGRRERGFPTLARRTRLAAARFHFGVARGGAGARVWPPIWWPTPVGVFLSGGTVLGPSSPLRSPRATNLQTFTVGFENDGAKSASRCRRESRAFDHERPSTAPMSRRTSARYSSTSINLDRWRQQFLCGQSGGPDRHQGRWGGRRRTVRRLSVIYQARELGGVSPGSPGRESAAGISHDCRPSQPGGPTLPD